MSKNAVKGYKRGWNWHYSVCDKVLPDGTRRTLIVEYQLLHHKYGTDVIVSSYPRGHPYEDSAIEAIGGVFRDFFGEARENEVAWKEVRERIYLKAWLIDAPIDSEIIKTFVAALAEINRVSLKINGPDAENKEG